MTPFTKRPVSTVWVEEIMRTIGKTVELKKIINSAPRLNPAESNHHVGNKGKRIDSTPLAADSSPTKHSAYVLKELLAFHDQEFVRNAYRTIMNREVDDAGALHYLQAIRTGCLRKIEVLGRLRYSSEGRREGTKIRWLMTTFAFTLLTKLPVIGYLIRLIILPLRLPSIVRHLECREANLHAIVALSRDQAEERWLTHERSIKRLAEVVEDIVTSKGSSTPQTGTEHDGRNHGDR